MFILFYKFLFFFNDLLEVQRRSFYLFLNFNLGKELSKIQPVINSRKLAHRKNPRLPFSSLKNEKKDIKKEKSYESFFPTSLYFLYANYKFITPALNIEESIIFSKTYCCRFYIPIQLIDSRTNFLEIQWIFLGTLPLLTKRGHFIINGTPRVVLNQIVRSPGIYFHKENSNEYESSRCFYAEIISKQGPWIRLEIDKKKKIWISFQQSGINRLSLPSFFQIFFQKYLDHQFFLWEKKKTLNLNGVLVNNFFWKENNENSKENLQENLQESLQKEFKIQSQYTSYIRKSTIDLKTNFNGIVKKVQQKLHQKFQNKYSIVSRLSKPAYESARHAAARSSSKPAYCCRLFSSLKIPITYFKNKKFINNVKIKDKKIQILKSFNQPYIYKESNNVGSNTTLLFNSSDRNIDLNLNLGKIGRKRINQRLGLSLKTLTLTPIDFLAISDILFQLTQNTNKDSINIVTTDLITTSLDDIDDLKNRQIKTIGELLQNQLARGIQRLHKTFENVFKKDFKKFFKYPKTNSSLIVLNTFNLEQQKRTIGWLRSNAMRSNAKSSKPAYSKPLKSNIINNVLKASTIRHKPNETNKLLNSSHFKKRSFTKKNSYIVRLQKLNSFKTHLSNFKNNFKRNFLWNEIFLNKNPIIKKYIRGSSRTSSQCSKPAYGCSKPAYGCSKPAYGCSKPAYGCSKPAYGCSKPAYGCSKPAYGTFPTVLKPLKEKAIPISSLFNTQSINSAFKEFFHSHQLSQYLDQSNPLAELTHKRRLSCLGAGGVNRDNAGMEIRGIHVSHYGRICPIETPEGKNAGLVNSLTTAVNISKNGYLETPFCEVFKQHTQNQKKFMFFSSENQEIKNVFFSQKFPQARNVALGVLNLKNGNFRKCESNWINLIAFNPQQFIAIATTCIPFVEHDDANRALMGSNMQRQALPLMQLEQPLVTTFSAFRVLSDLKDIPTSINSSIILYASQQKISLYKVQSSY